MDADGRKLLRFYQESLRTMTEAQLLNEQRTLIQEESSVYGWFEECRKWKDTENLRISEKRSMVEDGLKNVRNYGVAAHNPAPSQASFSVGKGGKFRSCSGPSKSGRGSLSRQEFDVLSPLMGSSASDGSRPPPPPFHGGVMYAGGPSHASYHPTSSSGRIGGGHFGAESNGQIPSVGGYGFLGGNAPVYTPGQGLQGAQPNRGPSDLYNNLPWLNSPEIKNTGSQNDNRSTTIFISPPSLVTPQLRDTDDVTLPPPYSPILPDIKRDNDNA
ncbi:uncharacterized protein LOC118435350 [Folsomia candida]|uniref:uncharacterized protein LOC118435350 n=1 Tax=Folsomia candida TaxID=158441 RepID=UPI00160534FB|nr:uncharacterized protein LOC118435350 [Folsomia candida]